ncbi:KEOPS complex subunit Cgi121 [Salinigranum salinum]|uniref:KEOPS complex subunit Cgi121 n=1 Tax=Salinigranum salinum TaxID=1364937 RepID=UPI001260C0D3|nr:KEOPS complex subunit Cgi121 [Salinigranum salinum]
MRLVEGIAHVDDVDAFVASLAEIGADHGVTVQAFDARYVVSSAHLVRAVELADRAFARDENVAHDRAVEILLYAAGRRQIDRALEMGVDAGEQPVVVLIDGGATGDGSDGDDVDVDQIGVGEAGATAAVEALLDPAETLGTYDVDRVRDYFDVGERELRAVDGELADLVLERVALLDVGK